MKITTSSITPWLLYIEIETMEGICYDLMAIYTVIMSKYIFGMILAGCQI